MSYLYKTKGTCSTMIEVELDGHIVKDVKFTGGCNGNLKAIPKLVQGLLLPAEISWQKPVVLPWKHRMHS